jgi:hypothetical protein
MFTQKKSAEQKKSSERKLYSIPALLRERVFAGEFESHGATYGCTFAPATATLVGGRLELTGRFAVRRPSGGQFTAANVKATLAATQGGLGTAPGRPESFPARAPSGQVGVTPEADRVAPDALPLTESTAERGFVGVMYFRLSPLDGRALGVPLDLSGVQLNARLAPTAEIERELQWYFSAVVAGGGDEYLTEINRLLKG